MRSAQVVQGVNRIKRQLTFSMLTGYSDINEIMLKSIPLKFVSRLLLLVMLTVAINCISESSHAMQGHLVTGDGQVHGCDTGNHQSSDSPSDQHQEHDCCDSCSNCAAHAPLSNKLMPISYNPVITSQQFFEPFKSFPEVFLPRFIPPQNQI